MRFVAAMAWREIRASWRRLILFFFCIALGVAASVTLRSFTQVISSSIGRDARALHSADVRVESQVPWTDEHRDVLTRHGASPSVTARTKLLETQTMVRAERSDAARPVMVELRGIDPAFPLRGRVRLSGDVPYSPALLAERGVLVSPSLLERLQLRVGDSVVIGSTTFTIRGAMERLPGNALNFSPIPRVVAEYDAVEAAGLTGFGSRVRYLWMFNTVEGEETAFARAVGREFGARRIRGSINTFHYVQNWLTGSLANVDGFLSLIGLALLVLGGIGVASVTRVFVQQRIKTVAILKCLGGRNRKVVGAYLAQVVALSFAGGLLGIVLAQILTSSLADYVSRRLPLDIEPRLSALACFQGVAVGMLVALLFALPPLLEIRDVKPILVLRHDSGGARRRIDWLKLGAQALLMSAIVALAGWQSGTYRNTWLFVGGIAATAVVLHGAGTLLLHGLARMRRVGSFPLRQGVGSLYRPGNQTRVTLFTVGLGALFVIAVRLMQVNMEQQYALDLDGLSADMFLMDVQPAQHDPVVASLTSLGATNVTMLALSRGRLAAVERGPSNPAAVRPGRLNGVHRLTERLSLEPNETVVAGHFWPATASDRPEVSVESGFAEWQELKVGDTLVFDIGGQRLEALVTSIRTEERRRVRGLRSLAALTRTDVVFRPGSLLTRPHTFVGGVKGPGDVTARARLQNGFMERYPGVTFVDALDDIAEIRSRVADVSRAVSLLGAFVFICGVAILVGSVAMTKMHRLYEAAILKTIGAKRRVLIVITFVEYAVLGALAGTVGSLASIAVTYALSTFGNRPLPWEFHPWITVAGAAGTTVLVILVGILSTWDVIARKPLGILKEQA